MIDSPEPTEAVEENTPIVKPPELEESILPSFDLPGVFWLAKDDEKGINEEGKPGYCIVIEGVIIIHDGEGNEVRFLDYEFSELFDFAFAEIERQDKITEAFNAMMNKPIDEI